MELQSYATKQIFKSTFEGLGRTQWQSVYLACVRPFLLLSIALKELETFAQESKTPSVQTPEEEEQGIQEEKQIDGKPRHIYGMVYTVKDSSVCYGAGGRGGWLHVGD